MKKEIVLVTGGAGFIGGHLTDALIKHGYGVRVLDNLAPPVHSGRLPDWFNRKADFIKGDVRSKKNWIKALRGVSYVFHLASYMDFHLDFSTYFDTNDKSTALMYEVIVEKKYPIKKIIASSSQSVYGEGKYICKKHGVVYPSSRALSQLKKKDWEMHCPLDGSAIRPLPQKETDMLLPLIPYGISKKTLEEIMFSLGRLYNIPSVALRYTIVLGPRQTFRHFYSGALRQFSVMALSGKPITMHEDSGQLRDYVDVRDVVGAHLFVLRKKDANFQAFNVGSGKGTRVNTLARLVAKVVQVPFNGKAPGLYRIGAPRHSIADIGKFKKLGWHPQHTLEQSVKSYVNWIKNYPEAKKYLEKTNREMKKNKMLF